MDKLRSSIKNLEDELQNILNNVENNVTKVAEQEYKQSSIALEETQALHERSQRVQSRLKAAIENHKKFVQQLEQLEQVYLISEDLKNTVRKLEKEQLK